MQTPPVPVPSGLYETHLTVANLETSVAFYRDIVGLELATTMADRGIAFFWVGGKKNGMLGLWQTGGGPLGMRLHFAFQTPLEQVLTAPAALSARGVKPLGFYGEPADEPSVLGWMPAASVFFKDPDGHSIEYIAVLDEAADTAFGVGLWSDWQRRFTD